MEKDPSRMVAGQVAVSQSPPLGMGGRIPQSLGRCLSRLSNHPPGVRGGYVSLDWSITPWGGVWLYISSEIVPKVYELGYVIQHIQYLVYNLFLSYIVLKCTFCFAKCCYKKYSLFIKLNTIEWYIDN